MGVLCAGCGCLRVRPCLSGPDLLSAPAMSYGHTPNWGNTVRDRKGLGACPGGGAIPLSLSVLLLVQARRRLCLPIRRLCRVHRRLRSSGSFWCFPLHRFVLFCLGVSFGSGCLWFDSMGSWCLCGMIPWIACLSSLDRVLSLWISWGFVGGFAGNGDGEWCYDGG
jgi:hypothetical protein